MDAGAGHPHSVARRIDGVVGKRALALFFLGIFLSLISLSPGVFRINGYMEEEISVTRQVLAKLHLFSDPSAAAPLSFNRNGAMPLLAHAPFVLVSHWLFGSSSQLEDGILSTQPVLLTAGIVAIIFLWGSTLSGSARWGVLLAICGAFTTILWPYAYIGLETQQSFFLLLAAYIALEKRGDDRLRWALLFAISAGMAVAVKSTSAFLLPAVAYLTFVYARETSARLMRLGLTALAIVLAIVLAAWSRAFFWDAIGGAQAYLRSWMVTDGLSYALNNVAFLASPNKGLLVYSPLLLLGLMVLPQLLRRREPIAIFALLTLAGLMGGYSILTCWADENWGPRYLHSTVAPLVLCIAAARRNISFRWRNVVVITALALSGFIVSGLGALFWYGSLHQVATLTNQNTLEWIHGDLTWNHIKFNGRLFLVWLKPADARDTAWTPQHQWYFVGPADAPRPKEVDLKRMADLTSRPMAVPQSWIFQRSAGNTTALTRTVIAFLIFAGIAGVILIAGVCSQLRDGWSGTVPVSGERDVGG